MESVLASTAQRKASSETFAKDDTWFSESAMQPRRAGAIICKNKSRIQNKHHEKRNARCVPKADPLPESSLDHLAAALPA
jgi:hypothetical protein